MNNNYLDFFVVENGVQMCKKGFLRYSCNLTPKTAVLRAARCWDSYSNLKNQKIEFIGKILSRG